MGKPRSRQPAHARPVRRSLVELTAAAVSSAARDGERVTSPAPIATFFEDVKAGETAAETLTSSPRASRLPLRPRGMRGLGRNPIASSGRRAHLERSRDLEFRRWYHRNGRGGREDHRAPVLQNLKVCVSASPGDVKDIASRELPTGPALEPATQEANSSHGAVSSEKTIPAGPLLRPLLTIRPRRLDSRRRT